MSDISYCAADCENIDCPRNKARIPPDDMGYHSWIAREDVPDCPKERGNDR